MRLLVLENISQEAVQAFQAQGFHVDHYTKAMSEDELVEKIGTYHGIGIRSKTKITARVIKAATKVRFTSQSVVDTFSYSVAPRDWLFLHRRQSG
jgi:phosphoglycerate dehydrogenase-like enzyme